MKKSMGPGGMAVGIKNGRPLPTDTQEQKEAKAHDHHQETIRKAASIIQDLTTTPTLKVIADMMEARIMYLIQQDEQLLSYMTIIAALRQDIEVAPIMAERMVHKIMGPRLVQMMKEQQIKGK